ncbi:MAG: peptide chain release factor N(5)-glutamine methyltransferase [Chloroflexi bacterium]|nr:peptide chain release factor N(5)-glutamine methyltransferase [Chloroflexota bacterium]
MNIGGLLKSIPPRLNTEWPELDAQLVIAHAMDKPRTWILAHPETRLSAPQLATVESAVARLTAGEPLPYILGHWEFFGHDLTVTPDVLIPRPETELLVEKAIAWLQASPERRTIADVGTGSGAIALTLAMHVPSAYILATDISFAALEVAKHNANKFDVAKRIDFVQCDLLPPHPDPLTTELHFDLICANLPYIPTKTLQELPIYGREPALALDGGEDGLVFIRRLLKIAPEWLAPNGLILLEIEASLGNAAISLAYDSFSEATIHLHQDLTGRDRLLEIQIREP